MNMNQLLEQYRDMKIEIAPALDRMKELEKQIKNHVKETGEKLEIEGARVKTKKGYTRSTWDSKGLKGYAVSNPDVLAFLTEKEIAGSVQIEVDA